MENNLKSEYQPRADQPLIFEKELNPPQLLAVQYHKGPLLVLAGAGSGKTRVITYRLAYLIWKKKVHPSQILTLTFTNKAANEMKQRAEALLGRTLKGGFIGTFHAFGANFLRLHAKLVGFPNHFVIFDQADQQSALRQSIKELEIDEKKLPVTRVLSMISRWKSELISPEEAFDTIKNPHQKQAVQVYEQYSDQLLNAAAMDFDDLLYYPVKILAEHQDLLELYQKRFAHILIDEYQDTNYLQNRLIRLLTAGDRNICAVGDDDQSIYRFRGADPKNILQFEKDFPATKIIRLEENYRSCKSILTAANSLIKENNFRHEKTLWTNREDGLPVNIVQLGGYQEEAEFVAEQIVQMHKKESSSDFYIFSDFCILYRTNAQSRLFEEALRQKQIPYSLISGLGFYERKEIKDLLSYLRLLINPKDTTSFQRIINIPKRGIGKVTQESIMLIAKRKFLSFSEALQEFSEDLSIPPNRRTEPKKLGSLLSDLEKKAKSKSAVEIFDLLYKQVAYEEHLKQDPASYEDRKANLAELRSAIVQFQESSEEATLEAFLHFAALLTDADRSGNEHEAVNLMTLHSAKGLEFPVVFICGLEEGLLPHQLSLTKLEDLEEERRLCYVGMTRAKDRLFLSYADFRMISGFSSYTSPSRFLKEIEKAARDQTTHINPESSNKHKFQEEDKDNNHNHITTKLNGYSKSFEKKKSKEKISEIYAIGMIIEHPLWGKGSIKQVEKTGNDFKLTAIFTGYGTKKFLAKVSGVRF